MSGIVEKIVESEKEEDLMMMMMMMMMMETKEDLINPEEKRLIKKNGQIKKKNVNKYQDFGVIKYTKSGNTNTTIVSQDFGGNKYSQNI